MTAFKRSTIAITAFLLFSITGMGYASNHCVRTTNGNHVSIHCRGTLTNKQAFGIARGLYTVNHRMTCNFARDTHNRFSLFIHHCR